MIPKLVSKKSIQGDNPQKWVKPIDSKSLLNVELAYFYYSDI